MKILRRLSLFQGVHRLGQSNKTSSHMERFVTRKQNSWQLSPEQELFKYGYKNNPKTYSTGLILISAFVLGLTLDLTQKQLRNNQVKTIYSYRIKQEMQSPIILTLRRMFMWVYIENLISKINPYYEYLTLKGASTDLCEKLIRYKQYKYYMKRRNNKYDFMELGVLQKFPYPVSPIDQKQ